MPLWWTFEKVAGGGDLKVIKFLRQVLEKQRRRGRQIISALRHCPCITRLFAIF